MTRAAIEFKPRFATRVSSQQANRWLRIRGCRAPRCIVNLRNCRAIRSGYPTQGPRRMATDERWIYSFHCGS